MDNNLEMNMKFFLIAILLLLLAASCNKKESDSRDSFETIRIPEDIEKHLLTDSLIEEFKIVPLETNDNSLISEIDQLISFDNKYFIHDQRQKSILVFDCDGKFLFKIRNIGDGPGEYSFLDDFEIDEKGNILLYDWLKILKYDKSGKFLDYLDLKHLRNEKNNLSPHQFVPLGDGGYYLWTGDVGINNNSNLEHFGLYRVDSKGKLMAKELPMERANIGFINRFYRNIQGGYYIQTLEANDTIYSISENGIFPAYFVDFGKKAFPKDFLPKEFNDMGKVYYEVLNKTDYCNMVHDIAENNDLIYFSFRSGTNFHEVLYSKKSKKVKTGKILFKSHPTSVGRMASNPETGEFISIMSDVAIAMLDFDNVNNHAFFTKTDKKIYEYFETIKDDYKNPFLIVYKLKKF
jgi:hypothetical protein